MFEGPATQCPHTAVNRPGSQSHQEQRVRGDKGLQGSGLKLSSWPPALGEASGFFLFQFVF